MTSQQLLNDDKVQGRGPSREHVHTDAHRRTQTDRKDGSDRSSHAQIVRAARSSHALTTMARTEPRALLWESLRLALDKFLKPG